MRDVRIGLLIAVPAAVALVSLIWFLRKKSNKKENGSGARRDSAQLPKTLKDHDKPEEQVPAHLSHRENQGITLTQRKIPEVSANGQRNIGQPVSGPPKSASFAGIDKISTSVLEEPNCEESLTSSQDLRLQEMVQSAIGDGILEASQRLSDSVGDGFVDDGGDHSEKASEPEMTENFIQECMMSATVAPVSSTAPPPESSQHLCSSDGDNNQNVNCSANNSLVPSVSLTPSKSDAQGKDPKHESNAGQLTHEMSSLTSLPNYSPSSSSSVSLHPTESPNSHSYLHGEQNVSSCDDHQLPGLKSNQNVISADHRCGSKEVESSSEQTIASSQNSFSEKLNESDSSASVMVESCSPRTAGTNDLLSDCTHSDSKMDTSKKSVTDTIYPSTSENRGSQQLDEPSASSISTVCDNNSVGSSDSGRGGSEQDGANQTNENLIHFDFNMPSDLCGRLIGRQGKNINLIKSKSGANVSLTNNPFTPEFQICQVIGSQAEVDEALAMIRRKFPLHNHPGLTMAPLNLPIPSQIESQPPQPPVIVPEGVQLSLPEGVSVDVYVSAIVNAGHVFVQQPTHRTFMSLEKLNFFLNSLYGQDPTIPNVPEPVECGVICVCENEGSWYRTMITSPVEENGVCQVKFVDYGGYAQLPVSSLKQIRTDFMSLPFQAVECFMANISPLSGENFFSDVSTLSLSERTQLKLLKCQVVARSEDGTPFVHLYDMDPDANTAILLNKTLVDDNLVRWVEIL